MSVPSDWAKQSPRLGLEAATSEAHANMLVANNLVNIVAGDGVRGTGLTTRSAAVFERRL